MNSNTEILLLIAAGIIIVLQYISIVISLEMHGLTVWQWITGSWKQLEEE